MYIRYITPCVQSCLDCDCGWLPLCWTLDDIHPIKHVQGLLGFVWFGLYHQLLLCLIYSHFSRLLYWNGDKVTLNHMGKIAIYWPQQNTTKWVLRACLLGCTIRGKINPSWWRHQMETFSALLALSAGNSPVPGEFPSYGPVTRSFDVFFDLLLNKRLSTHSRRRWFETSLRSLWRHCNVLHISAPGVWFVNILAMKL